MSLLGTPPDGNPQTPPTGLDAPITPPANGQPLESPTPQIGAADTFSREYVEQLRTEAAERRQANKDLKAQLDSLQSLLQTKLGIDTTAAPDQVQTALAQLTDLQAKFADADKKRRESDLKAAVVAEASKIGIADPMDAYRLADLSNVKHEDDGTITGVAELIKALAESKPYLLKPQGQPMPPRVGATNPAGAAPNGPPQWIIDQFRPNAAGGIGQSGVIYNGNE